ncbi:hypothetical protein PoB_006647900 [Plakobranchus ocellatus]|uniref:Uncharacterized protein n=1 Tax=Plakobranchus ocellatus TaxID=259542 RepID=A0AAV4D762_9GAST|nr:hypothetical protein PoB_006647900 [Plakobranchus ocellatus]
MLLGIINVLPLLATLEVVERKIPYRRIPHFKFPKRLRLHHGASSPPLTPIPFLNQASWRGNMCPPQSYTYANASLPLQLGGYHDGA